MAAKVRLDSAGIRDVLTSKAVASTVAQLASAVAGNVSHTLSNGDDLPTDVDTYTTDRAAAGVTITHPAGLRAEAKHGVLARAASAAGLDVTARPPKE